MTVRTALASLVTRLAAGLGLALVLFVLPLNTYAADKDAHLFSSVDTGGAHIVNGAVVSVDNISSISNYWTFNFTYPYFVNGSRAALAVMRGTPGNPEGGTLVSGQNFYLQSEAFGTGINFPTKQFGLAPLGTLGLQSGTYTAVLAELSNPGTFNLFVNWLQSGDPDAPGIEAYSTLTFTYDATPHPTELASAIHDVTVGGREINEGDEVFRDELQALNGSTDNYWIFDFDWPDFVPNQQAQFMIFRGTFGNVEGGPPQLGINYGSTVQAWAAGHNEFGKFISLPALKDPSTAPSTYTVVVSELDPKYLGQGPGDQSALWFASGGAQGIAPKKYSFLTFEFKGDGPQFAECCSNVMFLPGIEGTRLYRPDYNGGTDKLWEPSVPGGDQDVRDLYLNSSGVGTRDDVYTKEKDIIDETPVGTNIYKSFIDEMDGLKSDDTINDWEPIAYDWRLSLDDILNNGNDVNGRIYYSGALAPTSTPYVIQELRHLAATSQTGKVTIVAHSNGGLLAKRLSQVLGADASLLIDKIILVASPQAGTPMAVPAGMHGYKQNLASGIVTSKGPARTFASTSPMFYNLLPSSQYFTQVDNPVITFDSTLPDWSGRYGQAIHSEETLDAFLTDTYGRVDSEAGDSDQPIKFNQSLLTSANVLHANLDTWVPPSGVTVTQLAGWGVPSTVTGVTYTKKGTGVKPTPNFTIDGDGTVVTPSALWTSQTVATNYWVDLDTYNRERPITTLGGRFPFDHSRILETSAVKEFIADLITDTTKPLADYTYLSTTALASSGTRLRYSLHSPLTLNLYDDAGHHTGISTTTGQLEEQIPGTYYTEFGDVKYIFTDANAPGHIVMNGYDTGTFTLGVDQLQGDTQTAGVTFADLPATPQSIVQIDIQSDVSTLSTMRIDQNGDGVVDTYVAPEGSVLSIEQLMINLTTAVQNATVVAKVKTQLLNKVVAVQKKIDKQKLKQSDVLAKLKVQLQKNADKGKIDAASAAQIGDLLDTLIAQSATVPLDPTIISQLQSQINTLTTTQSLKNSLSAKVTKLQNLANITKSLASMTQAVTKKGNKGQISDVDVQSILNLLEQINQAL